MEPGTSVLLYTDGLLDAYMVDQTSDTLGITELVDALRPCCALATAPLAGSPGSSAARRASRSTTPPVVVLTVERSVSERPTRRGR